MMNPEEFWANTEVDGPCVMWKGPPNHNGYGQVRWRGRVVRAHRLAFFLRMGRWPRPGLELRHLCNRPLCVLHVVEGTRSENMLDAVAAGTHIWARKTHCPSGHPYDEANTYLDPKGYRFCRTCRALRHAAASQTAKQETGR